MFYQSQKCFFILNNSIIFVAQKGATINFHGQFRAKILSWKIDIKFEMIE